jgi:hypothetical protein
MKKISPPKILKRQQPAGVQNNEDDFMLFEKDESQAGERGMGKVVFEDEDYNEHNKLHKRVRNYSFVRS